MRPSIEEAAAAVRAVILDVDGVLTRGEIIHGPDGEWKVFNVQDGHAFDLARQGGLKTAFLTGRSSEALRRRARELQVDVLEEGVRDKGAAVEEILRRLGVEPAGACYVGDDLVDLPAMARVGLAVAVANAVDEVKAKAAWVTTKRGGEGAAREVIEFLLKARGAWAGIVERYSR